MSRRTSIILASLPLVALIVFATPFGANLRQSIPSSTNNKSKISRSSPDSPTSKSQRPAASPKPSIEETKELLKSIELGDIDIPDLTLEDTVTELNKRIEASGISKDQLTIVFGHSIRGTLLVSEVRWHGIKHAQVSLQTLLTREFSNLKIRHSIGKGVIELLPLDEESPLPGKALFEEKINDITLPIISFEKSNLGDLTWFLSQRSHELDALTLEAEFKGVFFVIRPPAAGTIPFPNNGHWLRRNLTIKQILDEVALETGTTWTIEDHAVIITAPTPSADK